MLVTRSTNHRPVTMTLSGTASSIRPPVIFFLFAFFISYIWRERGARLGRNHNRAQLAMINKCLLMDGSRFSENEMLHTQLFYIVHKIVDGADAEK